MLLRKDFNPHLADAYCTALLMGQTIEAPILLGFPSFPHRLLIEKFCQALDENNIDLVNALHSTGFIDINGYNESGDTPLTHALRHKMATPQTIDALLKFPNIDVNKKTIHGDPPIKLAVHPQSFEQLRVLLSRPNLDVNATDDAGFTGLMIAPRYGHVSFVVELLKHPHINVNAKNCHGMTALMIMARFDNQPIIDRMLRVPDLKTRMKDRDGNTARDHAGMWANNGAFRAILNVNSMR